MESKNGNSNRTLIWNSNYHIPAIFRTNQLPSYATNCIDDWEKVDAIANQTLQANMTLISGFSPWVEMYFEALKTKSGKQKLKIFSRTLVYTYMAA